MQKFQWELWKYCNNNCKFCILGKENAMLDKSKQIQSLQALNKSIDNLGECDTMSLIGGEFFQGQLNDIDVRVLFFQTVRRIFDLYVKGQIKNIWITCVLTSKNQQHLYNLLDIAEQYRVKDLWLCTSWDTMGRFHSPTMKSTWETNITDITRKYPWVHFVTNIILQQSFIDAYLSDEFKPKEFMEKYHTLLFFNNCSLPDIYHKEYCKKFAKMSKQEIGEFLVKEKQKFNKKLGYDFFPTRESFIKFLTKYHKENRDTYDKLYNVAYECDKKLKYDNETIFNLNDEQKITCDNGHDSLLYAPYVDSSKCCECEKEWL